MSGGGEWPGGEEETLQAGDAGAASVTQISRIASAEAGETPSDGPRKGGGPAESAGEGARGGSEPVEPAERAEQAEGESVVGPSAGAGPGGRASPGAEEGDEEYSYSYSYSDSDSEPAEGRAERSSQEERREREAAASRLAAAAARSPVVYRGARALSPLASQSRAVESSTESSGDGEGDAGADGEHERENGDATRGSNPASDPASSALSAGSADPARKSSGRSPGRPSQLHFAPSDTGRVREKRPTFRFLNSKNFDWFTFRSEVNGMQPLLLSYLERPDMPGLMKQATQPVRNLRNHKYSIYEVSESSYIPSTLDYGVPAATPSQKSEAQVPPVLRASALIRESSPAALAGYRARLAGFALLQLVKAAFLVLTFALPTIFGTRVGIGLISLYVFAEILVADMISAHASFSYAAAQTEIRSLIFDASSTLASAVPRTLLSECGHAKFLRRQHPLSVASILFQVVFNLLALGSLAVPLGFFLGELLLPSAAAQPVAAAAAKVMLVISGVLSACLYYFTSRHSSLALGSRLYCHRSLACNLRGFYPSCAFALDFSDAHMYDEGLCYFFTEGGPKMFVPFLAIVTAELRLEPIDVRLKIRFNRGELATMDGRKDPKVSAAHSRGYDAVEYQDFQAWVVLGLSNNVKLWLPLSLTQYKPTMFGLQGEELATLLDVASSALRLETDENEKLQGNLRRLAQFCRYYQEERRSSVAEEGMHMGRLERLVLPSECE